MATEIQRHVRGHVLRKTFLKAKSRAICIQTFYREMSESHKYQELVRAPIAAQALVRGFLQRKIYKNMVLKHLANLENQFHALRQQMVHVQAQAKTVHAEPSLAGAVVGDDSTAEEKKDDFVYIDQEAKQRIRKRMSSKQRRMLDESEKMIEFLSKQVEDLRKTNADIKAESLE